MEPNPGARGCLLWEGTFYSIRKGHEQSIWNKEETQVKAHCLPFPKPQGTAVTPALSVKALLKYAVLPVWPVRSLLLSPSLHRRCRSPLSLARGQLLTSQTSSFQITVTYSSKIDTLPVLSLFTTWLSKFIMLLLHAPALRMKMTSSHTSSSHS